MATTASAYYPYDAGTGANITEAQWRTMMGNTTNTGVVPGYLNGLATTGDSTGMQVKVATGGCWIYGAYGENSTSVQTISVAASHATLHRYDLIVARNNYTTNVIEWDVIQGTNSASPTVPTVTIDTTKYEIALAYVYIAATVTTITATNVTDVRQYSCGNNAAWRTWTPDIYIGSTKWTIGNGTSVGRYYQDGKTIKCYFEISLGSTTSFGAAGTLLLTLPVTAAASPFTNMPYGYCRQIDSGVSNGFGHMRYSTSTRFYGEALTHGATASSANIISNTSPMTWANGDVWSGYFEYEAA